MDVWCLHVFTCVQCCLTDAPNKVKQVCCRCLLHPNQPIVLMVPFLYEGRRQRSVELFLQEEGQKAGKMKKKATVLNLVARVKQTRQEQIY